MEGVQCAAVRGWKCRQPVLLPHVERQHELLRQQDCHPEHVDRKHRLPHEDGLGWRIFDIIDGKRHSIDDVQPGQDRQRYEQ